MNWTSLGNTLQVAAGTALVSTLGGMGIALWGRTLEAWGRRALFLAALLALVLPSFLVANTWMDFAGPGSALSVGLSSLIFSRLGVVWVLSLQYWGIPALALWGAWSSVSKDWFEVDPELHGFPFFWHVLRPISREACLYSGLVVFILAMNQVSVPTLFQVKVISFEVWTRYSTDLDTGAALLAAWPMYVLPFVAVCCFRGPAFANLSWRSPAFPELWRNQLGDWPRSGLRIAGTLLVALSLGAPMVQLLMSRRTWAEWVPAALAASRATGTSIAYAAVVATGCVLVGLWGHSHLVSSPTRFRTVRRGFTSRAVDALLGLLFLVPGMLLAIGALGVGGRAGAFALYGTSGLALLVLALHHCAIGWFGVRLALSRLSPAQWDALSLMPLSWSDALLRVVLPQVGVACAAAWYATYVLVLWDVEILTLLQVPGGETLALRIFNLLHYGHNDQVNALCLQLAVAATLPALLGLVAGRIPYPRRRRGGRALAAPTLALASGLFLCGCGPTPTSRSVALPSSLFQRIEIWGERGTAAGQFNKPRSLAVDREDNLYVVDMTARVQKFSPDGRFLLMWQLAQTDLGKPKGMGCDNEGNIVVVEPHYQRVNHFSTNGVLLRRWGTSGTNTGQLTLPRSVAVDAKGTLWLTEYTLVDRVQAFLLPEPKWLRSFGRPGLGNGEFNRAEGIALDASGQLYVADSCNHRVQVFSPDGAWLRSYGRAGAGLGEMSYPYDVKVDGQGRQFVCEFGNSRIQVFDPAGRPLEIIGGYGSAPGLFGNPWSLALDSHGNLYVADSGNHRVQKLVRR